MKKFNSKKYCSEECSKTQLCDFCTFYHYNGIDLVDENKKIWECAIYCDKGYCELDFSHKDPDDGDKCKKFICFRVKKRREK